MLRPGGLFTKESVVKAIREHAVAVELHDENMGSASDALMDKRTSSSSNLLVIAPDGRLLYEDYGLVTPGMRPARFVSLLEKVLAASDKTKDSDAKAPASPVERGLAYLASTQQEDGSFEPNRYGLDYRRGITGLVALALLNGDPKRYSVKARSALDWLAKNSRVRNMYAHGYAALALCEGALRWKKDYLAAATLATKHIVNSQHENGGWGYEADPKSPNTEACMAALMLHALYSALQAGVEVPKHVASKARSFLRRRFDSSTSMFNNELDPSPTYGATAMAVAALEQWGEGDSKPVRKALAKLGRIPPKTLARNLKGTPFRAYNVTAHGIALRHAADPNLIGAWLSRVRKPILKQQGKDGSWDGFFGKAYGTALVCFLLSLDATSRLAWLRR